MPRSRARARTAGEARAGLSCTSSSSRVGPVSWALRSGLWPPACAVTPVGGCGAPTTSSSTPGFSASYWPSTSSRLASSAGSALTSSTSISPSVSMTISVEPIDTWSPTSPASSSTVPDTGDSISTVALSVIISAICWSSSTVSPTLTCQATTSASEMPSPISGRRNSKRAISGVLHDILERLADADGAGEIGPFEAVGVRRVETGDALDRRLQRIEATLLDQRRQLGAEARCLGRFVDDHATAGLLHRFLDRVDIERQKRAQIDDLGIDARFLDHRAADMHHRAISEDGQRLTGADDVRLA